MTASPSDPYGDVHAEVAEMADAADSRSVTLVCGFESRLRHEVSVSDQNVHDRLERLLYERDVASENSAWLRKRVAPDGSVIVDVVTHRRDAAEGEILVQVTVPGCGPDAARLMLVDDIEKWLGHHVKGLEPTGSGLMWVTRVVE